MNDIKKMSVKEFREKGYLQELNRKFLHPLGLAIEVVIDDETGEESLGGIWDCRDDKEGLIYDLKNSNPERIRKFKEKAKYIEQEFELKSKARKELLGFVIEPIPEI